MTKEIEIPDGYEHVAYDPTVYLGLIIRRDMHGLIVTAGGTTHALEDNTDAAMINNAIYTVERAVLIARLRAWADTLEDLAPEPKRTC